MYIEELGRKMMDQSQSTGLGLPIYVKEVQIWICLNIEEGNGHKNDGLEPKYRFGFVYIYDEEIWRKIMWLAEVQIWISLNVYRGIRKKNDGLDPKYRFVFA